MKEGFGMKYEVKQYVCKRDADRAWTRRKSVFEE